MNKSSTFPRGGQIWEVIDGCDVQILYLFSAPITLSGSGRLAAGEPVCITDETHATAPPSLVNFLPLRYDELHDSLVPADIRNTPRYVKYAVSVKPDYFHGHFRLIDAAA